LSTLLLESKIEQGSLRYNKHKLGTRSHSYHKYVTYA
jgi:hypothetical protein